MLVSTQVLGPDHTPAGARWEGAWRSYHYEDRVSRDSYLNRLQRLIDELRMDSDVIFGGLPVVVPSLLLLSIGYEEGLNGDSVLVVRAEWSERG